MSVEEGEAISAYDEKKYLTFLMNFAPVQFF